MRLRLLLVAGVLLFATTSRAAEPARCRFVHQSPPVGQLVVQDVHFVLAMIVETTQGEQTIETAEEGVERRQRRRLTVLESSAGRTTKIRLTYVSAEQTRAAKGKVGRADPQPVSGKTYFVERVDGRLEITDRNGKTPPAKELAIVRQNMVGVGQPNPLAQFLNGRTFEVGRTVAFPESLARDLLGMQGTLGDIQTVGLTLKRIQTKSEGRQATFDTVIEARPVAGESLGMKIDGQLVVEIDTCRVVAATFSGPITLLETTGPPEAEQTVRGHGTLNVEVDTSYTQPRTAARKRRSSRR